MRAVELAAAALLVTGTKAVVKVVVVVVRNLVSSVLPFLILLLLVLILACWFCSQLQHVAMFVSDAGVDAVVFSLMASCDEMNE